MNAHKQRWITSIIFTPILVALIIFGSELLFLLLITSIILVAVLEYNRLVFGREGHILEKVELVCFSLLFPALAYQADFPLMLSAVSFFFMIPFILHFLRIKTEFDLVAPEKVVIGFIYIPLLMSFFVLLRLLNEGVLWIFFVIIIAFSGDVFAYYAGKTLGTNKLIPSVSPGKTKEGTLALIAGSLLGGGLFQQLIFHELPFFHALILSFLGGILGQLGDLFESSIKRISGVKDSGSILPGHGGIMDRIDCLTFIAPFVYYYQHYLIS